MRQFVPRRMSREMKLLNLRLRRVLFPVLIRSTSEPRPRLNHCRRVRLLNSGNARRARPAWDYAIVLKILTRNRGRVGV